MLLVPFATLVEFGRSELHEPLMNFSSCPIESGTSSAVAKGKDFDLVYFGYELSPKPKDVNWVSFRNVGGSRFRSKAFHKDRALCGKSPWPVVETTKKTRLNVLNRDWNILVLVLVGARRHKCLPNQ